MHPLRKIRTEQHLTQWQLQEATEGRVRQVTISKIELGADARLETFRILARTLNCSVNDLIPEGEQAC